MAAFVAVKLSTPSLGITSLDFSPALIDAVSGSAFNSLSRDHVHATEKYGTNMNECLSTPSLGITCDVLQGPPVLPAFNSLSRDHGEPVTHART